MYRVDISCLVGLLYGNGLQRLGIDWIYAVEIGCRLDMGCRDGYCQNLSCIEGYGFDMGRKNWVLTGNGL